MDHLWQLVVLMGIVTYIPRMLPMVFLSDIRLPRFFNSFLRFVPYAALGALIFPGILNSTGNTESALAGGIISIVLAFLRMNLILVVFGGILGVFMWGMLAI
ncbi:MAG: AzlD domain-containing protein [Syntrophomonas sp.]|nr:AzlD domain-containing protein [Syntrophomonas sp.]